MGNRHWEAHSGAYVEKKCRAAEMTTRKLEGLKNSPGKRGQ